MSEAAAVSVIGLGAMGSGMALRLRDAGFPLTVFNRTAGKTAPLARAGAQVATSIAGAAEAAGIVVLSLSDEESVERVLFAGLAGRLRPGSVVVDTSTVSPEYSVDATERLARAGARRLEACVLGNPPMARAGKLRIFTAGLPADAAQAHEVLTAIGQDVRHIGTAGSACTLKLAFNLILGNQIAALAEAVAFAASSGLDRDMFLSALTASGFSSPTLAFRAEMVRDRRYEPAQFRGELMEKDLRLAVEAATSRGLALPVTACAAERFRQTVLAGDGGKDAAAIAERGLTSR